MEKSKKFSISLISLLSILLLLTISYAIKGNVFKYVSLVSSVSSVILLLLIIFNQKIKTNNLFIIFILYIVYNIFLLVCNFSVTALYKVFQELILVTFSFLLINIKLSKDDFNKIVSFFSKIYYVLFSVILILIFLIGDNYIFNFLSRTVLKVIFVLSYFGFIKSNKKFLYMLVSAILYFYIGERTPAIIILFIYFIYTFFSKNKSKTIFKSLFLIVIVGLLSFILIYISLPKTELGMRLNQYSRELSGENFFSGRNVIWSQVFETVKGNELFGLTYNNDTKLYYGEVLSTHNLYLWLYMNGGVCLLLLFIIYVYNIWKKMYLNIDNKYSRAAMAYFLGFLVLCNFELLLLVNNFSVSMFMWLVISFGINLNKVKD